VAASGAAGTEVDHLVGTSISKRLSARNRGNVLPDNRRFTETRHCPGTATTYTPQSNPHYYFAFQGDILGPSVGSAEPAGTNPTPAILQTANAQFYNVISMNPDSAAQTLSWANLSVGRYAGVTIDGVAGQMYGIQYSADLNNPAAWRGLANVTLSAPKQTWFDSNPRRHPYATTGSCRARFPYRNGKGITFSSQSRVFFIKFYVFLGLVAASQKKNALGAK